MPDDEPVVVNTADREAATRALTHNWPNLERTSPKYIALHKALAEFHNFSGQESFELRYNLRPPRDRIDKLKQQLMRGQLTDEEFRARLKADAERPIDLEMLTEFCKAFENNVSHYSAVLQKSVIALQHHDSAAWQANETAIDDHIAVLNGKLPLWRENLETVFEFLEELRIGSGDGLLKIGKFEATSAHWLAQLLFKRMTEGWRSCKQVSERSIRDPRYLYSMTAIELFARQWLQTFPAPQSISERLREEFIRARLALKRAVPAATAGSAAAVRASADTIQPDQSIDNESRELVLIGEILAPWEVPATFTAPSPTRTGESTVK